MATDDTPPVTFTISVWLWRRKKRGSGTDIVKGP